ncbi:MAG: Gx transporter family protein [Caldisericaceae bacterium]
MQLTQRPTNLKHLTYLSILIALGIVLNFFEAPIMSFIPGAKLGLANFSTLLAMLIFSPFDGVIVAVFRTTLGSILKGTLNPISFGTSFLGGVFAALVMAFFLKFLKKYFSTVGISVIGGLSNNLAQFFFVLAITKNVAFWGYFIPLIILGSLSGFAIGIITNLSYNELKKVGRI